MTGIKLLCWLMVMGVCWGRGVEKKRVLVIVEGEEIKETHSMFFEDLKRNGFALVFKKESDKSVVLDKYGELQYDHLMLFAPTAKSFGKKITGKEVLDFVDAGRNVMLVGSPEMSKKVFDVAAEVGADFETTGSQVMDHVHYAKRDSGTDHSLIVVEPEEHIQHLFDKRKAAQTKKLLLFRGIGHSVAPDNDLVTVALAGNPTSYAFNPTQPLPEDQQLLAGKDVTLISLMQTHNNGRVTIVGSLDFFSNELFTTRFIPARHMDSTMSSNRDFSLDLALWTFQSIGVLRTRTPHHFNPTTGQSPSMYTVKEPIRFEVDILEYVIDKWVPYRADDIQLEYFMMYPYIRTQLQDLGNGTFAVDLRAPDVYGVFKFLVNYHRPGYSNIDITEMAPIRPFRHNEYERFIPTAYPYYASVFSMMAGFWLLGIFYLYHK